MHRTMSLKLKKKNKQNVLFKLMPYFISSCLLHVLKIFCSSSGSLYCTCSPIITGGVKKVTATKRITPSAFTRQGDADGIFLILRMLFTMSFYHKAGQSLGSIMWKVCNVFVRQSGGKKKTWCVAGEWMDAPTWQRALTFIVPCPCRLGQTRDDCPSTASVLSRSRSSWLLSVSKAQISAERPPFWVYWGDQDKFASAFALHS